MEKFYLIRPPVLTLFFLIIYSCDNDKNDTREPFNVHSEKIIGEWTSQKKCGGWSGGCSAYSGDTLTILEYGDFVIRDTLGKYAIGYINIINQDSTNLKIKFIKRHGELRVFSYMELFVTIKSIDTLILSEGCCDLWSYEFLKKE